MKVSPDDWVLAGLQTLGRDGVEEVRVERLARELKVTKGSFYHHFANRRSLLTAMLQLWRARGTADIIEDLEGRGIAPGERFRQLVAFILKPHDFDAVESGLRAWASRDPEAAEVVREVDRRRLRYVTGLLTEAGFGRAQAKTRSLALYRLIIGDFMWRAHGGPALSGPERERIVALFLAPADGAGQPPARQAI